MKPEENTSGVLYRNGSTYRSDNPHEILCGEIVKAIRAGDAKLMAELIRNSDIEDFIHKKFGTSQMPILTYSFHQDQAWAAKTLLEYNADVNAYYRRLECSKQENETLFYKEIPYRYNFYVPDSHPQRIEEREGVSTIARLLQGGYLPELDDAELRRLGCSAFYAGWGKQVHVCIQREQGTKDIQDYPLQTSEETGATIFPTIQEAMLYIQPQTRVCMELTPLEDALLHGAFKVAIVFLEAGAVVTANAKGIFLLFRQPGTEEDRILHEIFWPSRITEDEEAPESHEEGE